MSQISKAARAATLTRLSDPTTGFNANLAAVASGYGVQPFTVDWSASSKQFYQGQLHPDDLDESTPSKYPMVMLYAVASANQNTQKFTEFAGTIALGLDFHLTWRSARALPAFDDLMDAVEDAVFATLNGQANQGSWPGQVVYNGELVAQRRPLEMDGENWRQTISFRVTFEVLV